MPNRPLSAYEEEYEYTEYARPRFSRTSWNSRELMPPPRAALSTPIAQRRSSCRGTPGTPSTRWACSVERLSTSTRPHGAQRLDAAAGLGGDGLGLGEQGCEGPLDLPDDLAVVQVVEAAATTRCSGR